MCLFIMATEYVGPDHRAMAGTFTWYFWTGALMMIALLAYLVRDWRKLSMITSAPRTRYRCVLDVSMSHRAP